MKKKQSWHSFLTLVLLFVLFLTPLIAAVILYTRKPHWLHHKTVNKGHLLLTPLNLSQLKLIPAQQNPALQKPAWFLFFLTQTPCRHSCQKHLYHLRQITHALGKNRYRVHYGFIVTNRLFRPSLNKDSNLFQYTIIKNELDHFFSALKIKPLTDGYFIADPLGKIILYFLSDAQDKDIYDDLNRLLNVSTLG